MRGQKKIQINAATSTTTPGYTNPNRQVVIRATGQPSESFPGQRVYHLRCQACAFEYGASGIDVKSRCCPNCQQGTAGEALPERLMASLFD